MSLAERDFQSRDIDYFDVTPDAPITQARIDGVPCLSPTRYPSLTYGTETWLIRFCWYVNPLKQELCLQPYKYFNGTKYVVLNWKQKLRQYVGHFDVVKKWLVSANLYKMYYTTGSIECYGCVIWDQLGVRPSLISHPDKLILRILY